MAQEEQQHQKYNNNSSGGDCGGGGGSNGGGRSAKKLKQKKIPQRGLGVAQLEKIRLEEQQQKGVAAGVSSPCFVIPLPPPPPPHHQSSSSSPFPTSSIDLSSTTSLFGSPPPGPSPTLDLLVPPPPPTPSLQTITPIYGSHQVASGGGSGGRTMSDMVTSFTRQGHYPNMWNELNYNGDVPRLDHGLACRTHLQNETSYPIWHSSPPVVNDRKQPHSSTMVTVPPFTSSSSGLGFPMELPSNQSIFSNSNYTPPSPWPEEEKMVGIKRPWPFSLENLPFPSKIPSIIQPIYRPEEQSLCGNSNGSTFKLEPGDCIISEGTSGSTALHTTWRGTRSELNHKNGIKENGTLQGDFLTLGPPATSSSTMGCKSNKQQPLASLPSHYPIPEFDLQSSQARSIEEPLLRPAGSSIEQQQQQPIHNFFPPKGQRVATTTNDHRRIEASDTVDLNLKL
ncbi:uncharacterized protein LOC122649468 [Telopea speciosissima]|uniref:uncharacterized protein LOC122649468 n=1 Tax=Telopea speciosissima TaxID=54955 RepID=UPI001CC6CD75|nr:uncharacterized protein LOC122649468 [Telopea speciosissima]XP_043698577.1 uncharacterized protein LOC122649468 [Telopea speciosissima]